jgi:hypothetical protein
MDSPEGSSEVVTRSLQLSGQLKPDKKNQVLSLKQNVQSFKQEKRPIREQNSSKSQKNPRWRHP